MAKIADICKNVKPNMREQAIAVCKIEEAMRKKLKKHLPELDDMPLSQEVTSTQGDLVTKSNPAIQELRALCRDYAAIVKVRDEILENSAAPAEVTSLDALRERFKVAK